MVEVRHHPERVVGAQGAYELAGHTHGERDGDPRREADRLDRTHGADGGDEAHDPVGRHRERVAAAHDDVAHLGVVAQPGERRLERGEETAPSPAPTIRERVQKRQ